MTEDIGQFTYADKFYIMLDCIQKSNFNGGHEIIPLNNPDRANIFWRGSYQASAFSLILKKTPAEINYFHGYSYLLVPKMIPRIIWPDKPIDDGALEFNKRFGLIPQNQDYSVYPLPLLGEMYLNFGVRGIIIGMASIALVYVLLVQLFVTRKNFLLNTVYSTAVIIPCVYHESNFSLVYGNIPLLILFVTLLCRVFLFTTNIFFSLFYRYRSKRYF